MKLGKKGNDTLQTERPFLDMDTHTYTAEAPQNVTVIEKL